MNRLVSGGYSALIEAAYGMIPARLHDLIRPHFLTGVDPVFAGLHHYAVTTDGRAYGTTAHVVYDYHQEHFPRAARRVTVVLPSLESVRCVVHELGHVLHDRLNFEPTAMPVTDYARTDQREAFAEAFSAWALPFGYSYGAAKDRLYETDGATVALLEGLAR